MIHCAIIEDEDQEQVLLQTLIERLYPEIVIDTIIDNVKQATEFLTQSRVDLVFLDNHLKGGYGLDVIKNTIHQGFEVIYETAYSDYAIEALNKGAAYYLLKPYSEFQFKVAVEKAIRKINEKNRLLVISSGHDGILKLDDILFIHSDGPYTHFILKDNPRVMASKNLGYFEKRLPENIFFRTHHSYIVNIDHVKKVEKSPTLKLVLSDGHTRIPVSQRKARPFYEKLGL